MNLLKIVISYAVIFLSIFKMYSTSVDLTKKFKEKISNNISGWMLKQIFSDLEGDSKLKVTKQDLQKVLEYGTGQEHALYSIIDGKLSITDNKIDDYLEDRHLSFNKAINDLIGCIKLPDVNFVVCFSDCDLNYNYKVPVFAFCKNIKRDKNIILLPDSQALELARNIFKNLKQYNLESSWNSKIEKGFWRGSTTGGKYYSINNYFNYPRTKLVKLSVENPDVIDAKFTQIIQVIDGKVTNKLMELGYYTGQNTSIKDHIDYKYQILIDGNSATWGGSWWRFLSNSLVIKQDSDFILWYYLELKPYEHYVPFKNDCSNLLEQIEWCIANDDKAQEIVKNVHKFAYENLTYVDMLVYIYTALLKYSEFQK